jgi:hypothetical protein
VERVEAMTEERAGVLEDFDAQLAQLAVVDH